MAARVRRFGVIRILAALAIAGAPAAAYSLVAAPQSGAATTATSICSLKCLPTLSTTVYANTAPVAGTVPAGSAVHDTATLSHVSSRAGGTVTYKRYANGKCFGVPVPQTVTVTNGVVPPSASFNPSVGTYSYRAFYSGDSKNYGTFSRCEPFEVGRASLTVDTVVYDAKTQAPITGRVYTGSSVYDTTSLTASTAAAVPTGTVTYTFFSHGDCTTGTVVGTQTVTLATGAVPNSATQGPLAATTGPYAFQAAYSGDDNYLTGSSQCEPFEVVDPTAITTKLSASTVGTGSPVTDAATLSGTTATAGGTVTYTVYSDNTCTAVVTVAGTVTVTNAVVPDSPPVTLTTAGTYYVVASYSGDTYNAPARSDCAAEALTVTSPVPPVPPVPIGPAPTGHAFGGDGGILLGGALLVTLGAGFGVAAAVLRRRRAS